MSPKWRAALKTPVESIELQPQEAEKRPPDGRAKVASSTKKVAPPFKAPRQWLLIKRP
jgi:hypothetical protein